MVKQKVVPLTRDEMERLLEQAADDDFYYMLFNVAKTTGRRLGEFYGVYEREFVKQNSYEDSRGRKHYRSETKRTKNLVGGVKVNDIDFERGTMLTMILKQRKRILSEVIITPEVLKMIRQYIITHKLLVDDYLFRKRTPRAIELATKKYAKKAGIEHNVVFHNFRHYFVTEMTKLGWSGEKIIKFTGHSSTSTLLHYDHSVANDFKAEALPDLIKL